jgi:hypothetical protein
VHGDDGSERFGTKLWADGESGLINADICLASAPQDLRISITIRRQVVTVTAILPEDSPRLPVLFLGAATPSFLLASDTQRDTNLATTSIGRGEKERERILTSVVQMHAQVPGWHEQRAYDYI